jgi:citrate lyase subunit beta/citryl-CoA lyase
MPGANERALEKAKGIPADALIFDLEDAVSPDAKPEARDRVCAAASSGGYGLREVVIRVNGLATPWGADDLRAAAAAGPAAVLVPKIDGAADIAEVERQLEAGGRRRPPGSGPCSRRRPASSRRGRSPPPPSGSRSS